MFRVLLVIPLALSLLWCPINCMAGSIGDVAHQKVKTGCPCCQKHAGDAETTSPESPHQPSPEEDCDCGSCLCHGAVRSDDHQLSGDDFYNAFCIPPLLTIELGGASEGSFATPRETSTRPPDASGMAVRILHQSFLL